MYVFFIHYRLQLFTLRYMKWSFVYHFWIVLEFGNISYTRVPSEEKPRWGWANTEAGVNVPDKRRLLKQYSYVMFIIKTLRDYFWQIVPLDKAVVTQEMKDPLIIFGF